jgi:hypothetical protein
VIELRQYVLKWKLNKQAGLAAPPVGRVRWHLDPKITWPDSRVSSSKRVRNPGGMRV